MKTGERENGDETKKQSKAKNKARENTINKEIFFKKGLAQLPRGSTVSELHRQTREKGKENVTKERENVRGRRLTHAVCRSTVLPRTSLGRTGRSFSAERGRADEAFSRPFCFSKQKKETPSKMIDRHSEFGGEDGKTTIRT